MKYSIGLLVSFVFFALVSKGQNCRFANATYHLRQKNDFCQTTFGGSIFTSRSGEDNLTILLKTDHSFDFISLFEEGSSFARGTWIQRNDSVIELNWDANKTATALRDTILLREYERCFFFNYSWAHAEKITGWAFVKRHDVLVTLKRKQELETISR